MSALLKIKGLSKSYRGCKALDNVNLCVEEGCVLGLLGPNGAGKTTLIRAATGITQCDSGEILFQGRPISAEDRMSIGYLPEERGLYPDMRVAEQLVYLSRLKGLGRAQAQSAVAEWLDRFGLSAKADSRVNELSKGMQQKVQFISAVAHKPRLLILDEPFSGFDPVNAEEVKTEIVRLNREGTTIVLSSHDMQSVEELCGYVALIDKSKLILQGGIGEVKERFSTSLFKVRTFAEFDSSQTLHFSIVSQNKKGECSELIVKKKDESMTDSELFCEVVKTIQPFAIERDMPSIKQIFLSMTQHG